MRFSYRYRKFLFNWLVLFCLCILFRLPYFLGPYFLIDGDEAVIGVMTLDLLHGLNLPFYFYGQGYGFSLFEVLAALPFVAILGKTTLSLKLGGLLLFSLGLERLFKMAKSKNQSGIFLILVAFLLAAFPAWLIWATKLRGGYITAFVAFSFLAENSLNPKKNAYTPILLALYSSIILVSQPFFILIALPFLVNYLIKTSIKVKFQFGISFILALFIARMPITANPNEYDPTSLGLYNVEFIYSLLGTGIFSFFSGFYRYSTIITTPLEVILGGIIFACLLLFTSLFYSVKIQIKNRLLIFILLGSFAGLFLIGFGSGGGRYILPFFSGLLVYTILILRDINIVYPKYAKAIAALFLIAFLPSIIATKKVDNVLPNMTLNDQATMNELLKVIEVSELKHGFCSSWELTWQLNYLNYSESRFRHMYFPGRIRAITDEVDDCLKKIDCGTLLVGRIWELDKVPESALNGVQVKNIENRYFVIESPSKELLESFGFQFKS